jgi:hypothetical protein
MINARAGMMRGVRLWADPDGILLSPFDESGQKMGYVLVYGEESPAVFDGKEWHSVLQEGLDWAGMHSLIADQYYKVIEHAAKNPEYAALAQHITGGVAV